MTPPPWSHKYNSPIREKVRITWEHKMLIVVDRKPWQRLRLLHPRHHKWQRHPILILQEEEADKVLLLTKQAETRSINTHQLPMGSSTIARFDWSHTTESSWTRSGNDVPRREAKRTCTGMVLSFFFFLFTWFVRSRDISWCFSMFCCKEERVYLYGRQRVKYS